MISVIVHIRITINCYNSETNSGIDMNDHQLGITSTLYSVDILSYYTTLCIEVISCNNFLIVYYLYFKYKENGLSKSIFVLLFFV